MTEKKEAQLLKRIERMDSNIFALREVIKEQRKEIKFWKDNCRSLEHSSNKSLKIAEEAQKLMRKMIDTRKKPTIH